LDPLAVIISQGMERFRRKIRLEKAEPEEAKKH